jgi:hypothetical protein
VLRRKAGFIFYNRNYPDVTSGKMSVMGICEFLHSSSRQKLCKVTITDGHAFSQCVNISQYENQYSDDCIMASLTEPNSSVYGICEKGNLNMPQTKQHVYFMSTTSTRNKSIRLNNQQNKDHALFSKLKNRTKYITTQNKYA